MNNSGMICLENSHVSITQSVRSSFDRIENAIISTIARDRADNSHLALKIIANSVPDVSGFVHVANIRTAVMETKKHYNF